MDSQPEEERCDVGVNPASGVGRRVLPACIALGIGLTASLGAEEGGERAWGPQGGLAGRLLLWDAADLDRTRERVRAGDETVAGAYERLIAEAERALDQPPIAVVDKAVEPPSGDKRDYLTFGKYWWPNPESEDGQPYIRRDGETNPEAGVDVARWSRMHRAVTVLVPAWYFSGESRYAEHAALLLRRWFLDEETGMNPNLKYAQGIPGRVEGRGVGSIDIAHPMAELLNSVQLLERSEAWTHSDARAMRDWSGRLLQWIGEHPFGSETYNQPNNIGTWFDSLVSSLALYSGAWEIAEVILASVPEQRFSSQIADDGRLPHELRRTRSKSYTSMGIRGFLTLAAMAERVSVDLWNAEEEGEVLLRRALDWLAPYALDRKPWEWEQITPFDNARFAPLYHIAGRAYGDDEYRRIARALGEGDSEFQRLLLYYPEL